MTSRRTRPATVILFASALLALVLLLTPRTAAAQQAVPAKGPPNIVVVLADDLGYGDLGCYGNQVIKTPNLDRLAEQGLRLTDCYAAAANCSPARTGLMTGRTPYRVGIHNWIPMHSPMHVMRGEVTVASLLRQAGYDTCHVGKWHLNGKFNTHEQPQPDFHGFRYWFSTQNNALPNHRNPDNFVRNGHPVGQLQGYAGPLVAREAIQWLANVRDPKRPFFLYCCFHEPHEPIATAKQFTDMYPDAEPSKAAHHGNVSQLDYAFGQLDAALTELGLRENTLLLFTSDNGPAITRYHPHGSAGPLRDKKGSMYEGGIRVPGIIRWPGHTQPGSVSHEPVCGVDLLPTLCEVAGIEPPRDRKLDGASFLPVLEGKPVMRTVPLYWQFNAARSKPKVAMRVADLKVLAGLTGPETKPYGDIRAEDQESLKSAELEGFELYDLSEDIAETKDLAEAEPEKLELLTGLMRKIYREVRDESPTWPAWKWPRYEAQRIEWPDYSKK